MSTALLPWVIGAPLLGAALCFVWQGRSERGAALFGVGSITIAALLSALIGSDYLRSGTPAQAHLWTWFAVDGLAPAISLYLDGLSLTMLGVITGVGALIHLYASWYMRGDPRYARFFAYMNLFVAAMLLLVLGDNLLALYFGWEGVGLCSYLLIGFWHQDPANGYAARKAFITTRVGDTLMALGLLLLFRELGTLDIQSLIQQAQLRWPIQDGQGHALATAACLLLLGGAVGKSAQLPLQTWLPDAMAGPTPVSALIHAATMVTAGVYLIARLHGLFALSPVALEAVGWVGALTLLLAGGAALVQTDIKRILAYSTMSQIGYMFLALGCGAYSAAIFHLMTHAFFKALLFMAAGSVILALHHEQDIFKMGGLRHKLPVAFWSFLIGSGALAAVPFITAGFYSKDEILFAAWGSGHGLWWAMGVGGAFLTGLYSFRLVFIVFWGTAQSAAQTRPHWSEQLPLFTLMLLSVIGGALALPAVRSVPVLEVHHGLILLLVQMGVGLAGIGLAWRRYGRPVGLQRQPLRGWRRLIHDGWGFDALYDRLICRPWMGLAQLNRADVVDSAYTGIVNLNQAAHRFARSTQSGYLRLYAVGLAFGLILLAGVVAWT